VLDGSRMGPVTTVWRATTAGARLAALSLRLVASVSSAEHQTRAEDELERSVVTRDALCIAMAEQ
jgi:hypothetical protein